LYLDTSTLTSRRSRFGFAIARFAEIADRHERGISSSRIWGPEVREEVIELRWQLRYTISKRSISDGGISRNAQSQVKMAELSHHHTHGDINNIISRSSTVRETSIITSNNSKSVLAGLGSDRSGEIESQHIGRYLVLYDGLVDSR